MSYRRSGMSRLLQWVSFVFAIFVLAGCATPYQPLAFPIGRYGGYTDIPWDANTFRVSFAGNPFTSSQTVEIYLLYRCAELTVQHGHDFFVVVERRIFKGGDPGGLTGKALIQTFKGVKPEDHPTALNAREVISNLGPRILRD